MLWHSVKPSWCQTGVCRVKRWQVTVPNCGMSLHQIGICHSIKLGYVITSNWGMSLS